MKRFVIFIITLILLAFPSCVPQAEMPALELDKPVFYLSELPELLPFEIPPQIINRYGGEAYSGALKPADDYGMLYPYLGEGSMKGVYAAKIRYGLVDAKGRIVVDPVYESAYYLYPDKGYLCLIYPVEGIRTAAARRSLINLSAWVTI